MMAALLGVLSLVAVPIPVSPVPVTLQTLGVLLAGGVLGPWWGSASVVLYIALGVVGAPVFAGGEAGIGVLVGPKGGYLLGFVLAALVMGIASAGSLRRASSGRSRPVLLVGGAIFASAAVYAGGVPWLGWVTGMGIGKAAFVGALPYLLGDVLKAAAAVALLCALHPALDKAGLGHVRGARPCPHRRR
jgi:biotin transport system substrate-specific component